MRVCEYLSLELSKDFGVDRTIQGVLVKLVEANLERELGQMESIYTLPCSTEKQAHLFSQSHAQESNQPAWGVDGGQRRDRVYHAHWFAADWIASRFYTKNK